MADFSVSALAILVDVAVDVVDVVSWLVGWSGACYATGLTTELVEIGWAMTQWRLGELVEIG